MEAFCEFMTGYCNGAVKAAKAVGAVLTIVVAGKKLQK